MGLGKRFSYKMSKNDETTPGPGMYSNTNLNSITNSLLSLSKRSKSNSRLAFGVDRTQQDKL